MASTQVARAAAQLHEAAQDVARVAASRCAQLNEGPVPHGAGEGDRPVIARSAAGDMARTLAARLAERGYQVRFPFGRDPAVFKVTGLPGGPDVEVIAEDDGSAACHYTGRSRAEAALVITRLSSPGHLQAKVVTAATATATWGGIEVEWHYQPPAGQSAVLDQVTTALLAHLAILGDRPGGKADQE